MISPSQIGLCQFSLWTLGYHTFFRGKNLNSSRSSSLAKLENPENHKGGNPYFTTSLPRIYTDRIRLVRTQRTFPKVVIEPTQSNTHTIHVWYIYLHLVDFYGKCREIYHTWIVWDISNYLLGEIRGRSDLWKFYMHELFWQWEPLPTKIRAIFVIRCDHLLLVVTQIVKHQKWVKVMT